MSEIIAFIGRHEPAAPNGACSCGLIIVGDRIVRRVGSVVHGALCCYREDEPPPRQRLRGAEMIDLVRHDEALRKSDIQAVAYPTDPAEDPDIAEREAIRDWETERGV